MWNDEAFENLVLPDDRKDLLKSLVESHNESGFDDFVEGKGHGLVINLFGPPGVGKTLSAEATSEHVRRPLYIVGGGDLGTTAGSLDKALNRVLDIATSWNAIVLIDEVGLRHLASVTVRERLTPVPWIFVRPTSSSSSVRSTTWSATPWSPYCECMYLVRILDPQSLTNTP